jgi:predicted AlkP superfamily phosphohydrolase/phosphomutase
VYRQVDAAVGRILEAAGQDVLTVLVSDHGVVPPGPAVPLLEILRDAGLLATSGSDADGAGGGGNSHTIDWTRSLAVPQGSCFIRVNEAGREPHGIVDPAGTRGVRGRVIGALLDYRDPVTGVCPFSLVVPKEDAAALGLRGDGVGDVVYALRPEFSEVHGSLLPDAELPEGGWGMPAMCVFSGVGAATGADLAGFVSLVDVAPTVCRALGVAPPTDSDGVVRAGILASEFATPADR